MRFDMIQNATIHGWHGFKISLPHAKGHTESFLVFCYNMNMYVAFCNTVNDNSISEPIEKIYIRVILMGSTDFSS